MSGAGEEDVWICSTVLFTLSTSGGCRMFQGHIKRAPAVCDGAPARRKPRYIYSEKTTTFWSTGRTTLSHILFHLPSKKATFMVVFFSNMGAPEGGSWRPLWHALLLKSERFEKKKKERNAVCPSRKHVTFRICVPVQDSVAASRRMHSTPTCFSNKIHDSGAVLLNVCG